MSGTVQASSARQVVSFAFAVALSSCSTGIDSELEHRACTPEGRCLPGYVCSDDDLCVRASGTRDDAARGSKHMQSSTDGGTPDAADETQVSQGTAEVLDGGERDARAAEPEPNAPAPMTPNPESPAGASAAGSGGTAAAPPAPNVDNGGDVTIPMPAQGAAGSTPEPAPTAGASGASTADAGGTTAPPPVVGPPAMPPMTPGPGPAAGSGAPPMPGGGMPAAGCAKGLALCSARCVDLATDANNCGSCGDSCDADEQCMKSKCHEADKDNGGPGGPKGNSGDS
jgi:Stigma-specific protein, Stig1